MTATTRRVAATLTLLCSAIVAAPGQAREAVLKFGTVAPKGTLWAKASDEMGASFEQISGGKVSIRTYAGVVGDEPTIVRKMRVGQLDGAILTSSGLSLISRTPMVLQLPMIFDSYAELDAVRDAIEAELNRDLDAAGFVVLAWGDAGWFHFFTKRPAPAPADVRGMKMWIWAHDPHGVRAFSALGFEPVVLSSVDLVPSLQTGLIESFPATPIAALALQSYRYAPHMTAVRWTPVIGATLITKQGWNKVPAELRPELLKASVEIGARYRRLVRAQSEEALREMQARGLQVHSPTPDQLQAWRQQAAGTLKIIRGDALDAALVDRVLQLRDRARAQQLPAAADQPPADADQPNAK